MQTVSSFQLLSKLIQVLRYLLQLLLDVELSLVVDLVFKLADFSLSAAGVLDEVDELIELGVERYQKLVGLFRVFIFFISLQEMLNLEVLSNYSQNPDSHYSISNPR